MSLFQLDFILHPGKLKHLETPWWSFTEHTGQKMTNPAACGLEINANKTQKYDNLDKVHRKK